MAQEIDRRWITEVSSGLVARDRRGGPYRSYLPDLLMKRPLTLSGALAMRTDRAERAVRALAAHPEARGLEGIARFLLRSEAIASSRIEGITPSPQQVALAELAQEESVRGFSDNARLVANNITVVRRATTTLAERDEISVDDIVDLHRELLHERHHGLRTVQNWIGGSNWHPLDAEFVPPPPERVPDLMHDLVTYLNSAIHGPLVQAAVVHAQFETIHPFTDGNGRVGRALIHTVLTRRGLTAHAVLPVSLVLATLSDRYIEGLTSYRYLGSSDGDAARTGLELWTETFLDAVDAAAGQALHLADEITALRGGWNDLLAGYRAGLGKPKRPEPRADSTTARILRLLPEMPVLTSASVQRALGASPPAAKQALDELANAGILRTKSLDRRTTGYIARSVLDLAVYTERALASTRFDTRVSAPIRPVPARPRTPMPPNGRSPG